MGSKIVPCNYSRNFVAAPTGRALPQTRVVRRDEFINAIRNFWDNGIHLKCRPALEADEGDVEMEEPTVLFAVAFCFTKFLDPIDCPPPLP